MSTAAITALLFSAGCSRGSSYYLQRGDQLFAAAKYADAALNFRKALQKDPNCGEAYFRLGLTDLKTGDLPGAVSELSRAAELLPGRDDVQTQLADVDLALYLAQPRRPQSLYNRLSHISDGLLARNPNSFDGLRIRGHVAKADGKLKEAEEAFRRANTVRPMEPNVVVPLVETLFQEKQDAEGEHLAKKLIQARKDFGLIYDALYSHYIAQSRFAEAEDLLKLRIANNPRDVNAILQLGFHYNRIQKPAEVASTLRKILDHPEVFPQAYLHAGEFYATLQQRDDAVRCFREGLRADPQNKTTYLRKVAAVLMAQGKREEAIQALNEVLEAEPKDDSSRSMRAILLVLSSKAEDVKLAVSELQSLSQQHPADAVLKFNLGRARLADGDVDGARQQFREALRVRSDYMGPRIALLELAERDNNYVEMLRLANEVLAVEPNNARGRLWHGMGLAGTGNIEQAGLEIGRLSRQYPQWPDPELELGLIDIAQNKFDEGEKIFRKLYRPGQSDTRAAEGLVRVLMAQHQPGPAIQLLAGELKRSPESTRLHTLLASAATATNNVPVAIVQYQWLVSKEPESFDFRIALAQAYQAGGELANALAAFQQAQRLAPKDARVMAAIAYVQDMLGRRDQARANYQRALEMDPENPVILNNLAFLLADSGGDLDEAIRLVERAQKKAPRDPGLADTLGWVYVKKNLNDSAIRIFSSLVLKYPDSAGFRYHLAVACLNNGDKKRAKAELQNALAHDPPKDIAAKIRELMGGLA